MGTMSGSDYAREKLSVPMPNNAGEYADAPIPATGRLFAG